MKRSFIKNSLLLFPMSENEFKENRSSINKYKLKIPGWLILFLFISLPFTVNATLTLPAIPSNSNLASRFEQSTEMVFRVKVGETYLPSGALIAYIKDEIRGAQTASVLFPPTGNNVYKLLVFNDKSSGDMIRFKYFDIFSDKIYDITEKIEFIPNQVPDFANPLILHAFCQPIEKVTGLLPENGKENLNADFDMFWQPSQNTSFYKLFLWEDGQPEPVSPYYPTIYNTSCRVYGLKYGQLYHWKISSVNDCSSVESSIQTFKTRQLPDLKAFEIQVPATIESGSNFIVKFTVKNTGIGSTAGGQWEDAIYVSNDPTFSNDDLLLSRTSNLKQLNPDSSYTQSVTISLPVEYSGDYYFFLKTDNYGTIDELSEDNNLLKSVNATHVALKSLPDILVKDIQSEKVVLTPGDSVTVSWKVENIGGVNAVGGWVERIMLSPVSGPKLYIEPTFEYQGSLNAGIAINRSQKIKIPGILRFSGAANIEVELIPLPELQEHPANKANNKGSSAYKITVADLLFIDFQTNEILENITDPVRCIVSRSGDYLTNLPVSLSTLPTGQVTIPASVTIPANQSSFVFNLNPIDNLTLDGSRAVEIKANAVKYIGSSKTITVLDNEVPSLTAKLSKKTAIEGETITLTVTRDLVTSNPLTVNISTNKPSQCSFPTTVVIPANMASNSVSVMITDDNIPELTGDAIIYTSSDGFASGQETISILDNDVPQVGLELLADTISESAGIYATWGIVKRIKGSDNITVNLSCSDANTLFFPSSIYLPKGTNELKFNIGAIDNNEVDGYRKTTISGAVFISSCGCETSAEDGGIVKANLVIADNDGPSLSVSVNPISLPEGKLAAGTLTITRNTPTALALLVNISYNDTSEVYIQPNAIIPVGQKSVQVPINTKNDNIEDGNQMVSIQAGATSFSSGFCYVFVTDQNKPDLQITSISINNETVATNDAIEITGTAFNGGFALAPSGVKLNFYCSKDQIIDDNDILLGEFAFPNQIGIGTSATFSKTVDVPDETGNYFILAKINPGEVINELVYFNNESKPLALTIHPEYTVTAIVDNQIYLPGSSVPIHGIALNSKNIAVPNVDVDVYILNNGTRRELKAKTNNLGEYRVDFVPLGNESGHYFVGASYPLQNLTLTQDDFNIPGVRLESSGNIIWEMKQGQTLSGKIAVANTSEAPLTRLIITADKLPKGCQLVFDTIPDLAGSQSKEFSFTLKATELTEGQNYEKVNFKITSDEGSSTNFMAYYYCQTLEGQLKADPASINTTMSKGKSRLYELKIFNNGAGQTGTVTITLPDVNWMTLVSPAILTNIPPQDTATVILNLTPTADIPLNTPISGSIAVNSVNGNGLTVPFLFEVVSEETGGLKVDVIDEYTYYTDGKPHVKNAHVVIRHPFSGEIVADGFTGEDGTFSVSNLPEGAYKMNIDADKHESYQSTITIDPGRVNEKSIFISFQAITYSWEVVPTTVQDNYEVQLVMKYETNVPVPVVIVEMPETMPSLVNDETYPFLVTLTNKGLITALDVQVNFPLDDPEYEFVTNFTKMDLLAQQSIQVPVVMKRKAARKSATLNQLKTIFVGPCTNGMITFYGWECGADKQWHQVVKTFKYDRICNQVDNYQPDPPPTQPIRWGGGDGGHSNPYNFIPTETPDNSCDPCMNAIANGLFDCSVDILKAATKAAIATVAPEVIVVVEILEKIEPIQNTASCVDAYVNTSVYTVKEEVSCLAGFLPFGGCITGALDVAYNCFNNKLPQIVIDVLDTPVPIINGFAAKSSISPILNQAFSDLAYSLSLEKNHKVWVDEFMGELDWQSKKNIGEFGAIIDSFTVRRIKIQPSDSELLKKRMEGKDITNSEIDAFVDRWNETVTAQNKGIYSPTSEFPNIIDDKILKNCAEKSNTALDYMHSRGFDDIGKMYYEALATTILQINQSRKSVCASVSINITQKVVMTREAFEGTLTIFNGHTSDSMKEIKLNLEIKDENGAICNDLFQIDTKALDILTGIDGTGTLGAQLKGSATILFIPEKGAAPTVPKSYSFGGSFSYLDPFTGVTVTKPLFPVTLDVNPSPDLFLHYFMQRDILGDDPITEPIEPIVPAEFAVMIQNNGYGIAQNVRIESAQPKIVDNAKGLAINFALIGSNLNGQPMQLGLTNIDFGNIAPKTSSIGQWWFTSDLMGHFVSYEAKLTHLDSRGNPNLSLISGVAVHELIKSVSVYDGVKDGINDFLVNEVQDAKEFPDVIYLSNGGTLDVYPASSSSISGSIAIGNHEIELLVVPSKIGWNYLKINDPGNGNYKIVSVTREDGQVIPLDNVWQTHVTMPDGKEPVYENMLHFLDVFAANSVQKYTIRFAAKDQNPPEIVRFEGVPTAFVTTPVTSINVVFNKPIDPATFNYQDMTLRIQGSADAMDASVTVSQIDPVTFKIDLTSKSTQNGFYALTVQASGISDLTGTQGLTGKQATWTQFINIPAISEFIGLPENNVGAPMDFILLKFNLPIDQSTLLPARFTWKKDGLVVSGSITITPMDTEGRLFQLSGLKSFLSPDGHYTLTVDLPNIKSLDGNLGLISQSVEWEIDQKVPRISEIIPSSDGGYDGQHKVSFTVRFTEPVKGFGTGSIELWKDKLQQPLSQLKFIQKNDSEYVFTEFRLLTYYEGSYVLKVKMKDIIDKAGNSAKDTIKYEWTVNRTLPKGVTNLHITPDMGFSATDNITAIKSLVASMNNNEPGSRIKLYQTDLVNPVLLADTSDVGTGPLMLAINLSFSGNLLLQAHCINKYNNVTITEIPIFIDETVLFGTWKNTPIVPVEAQPDALQIEFSDKLLDDSKIKETLKFELDGKELLNKDLTVTKSTDKLYVLSGMDKSGKVSGTYSLSVDLSKLQKYTSGKPGVSLSKTQWSIANPNKAPVANAGTDQSVDEEMTVTLDGSASTDPDGNALTFKWTAPAGITLSSESATKPTFVAPKVEKDTSYTFSLVVNDGLIDSPADQVVIQVKNVISLQSIPMIAGWNIISANVIPSNVNLMDIFKPLINSGNLKKVMDESGKTIENFGVFGGWKNNIGNLTVTEGYKVNMGADAILSLEGTAVQLPMGIGLTTGWNIISYPANSLQDALALVQSLIDAGKLVKVMDETGKTIENFGVFGGWKNNLGNFIPGKGYKVNVSTDCTLTIPANSIKAATYLPEIIPSVHFAKVFEGNGTDHMNINLVGLGTSGLQAGDEIGIFDGGYCVGAATVGVNQMTAGIFSIPASVNENTGENVNGFTVGHQVELQLFKGEQAYKLDIVKVAGSETFEKNGSLFVKVQANDLPDLTINNDANLFTVYPNPFKSEITIEVWNPEKIKVDVAIFNLLGQRIKHLFNATNEGQLLLKWDGTNDSGQKVVPGIYFCKVNKVTKKVFFKDKR